MPDGSLPPTLAGLLERYSPTGEESLAVSWLVTHMHSLGYTRAEIDPAGNAVGMMGEGPRQIVLLGHIDTVPGEIPLRQQGDLLYARGAVDAKGPLAVLVESVARLGVIPGWQLVVIGAVGEEGDSVGARYVAGHYLPAFTIIGEPSRWDRVTLGYKGSATAEIVIRRPMLHTAAGAESACEVAIRVWEKIRGWAEEQNASRSRAFDQISPGLRGFSSGTDGFAEWANLHIGARLPLDLSPKNWYERLERLIELPPPVESSLQPRGFALPAFRGDKNNPLVKAFLAGIRGEGGQPGFVLKTGTSDLNLVAPAWECPALAYGPGDSSLDHTPHEHISLTEYRRSVEVLCRTLSRLTQPAQ
jgi:LysW-gamma-L-lysine carboxypeptidase